MMGNTPDLIIKGGTIITMKEGQEVIRDADILVSNGRIMDIVHRDEQGPKSIPQTEVIDAQTAITMPGLINTHTHLAMTLFRGYADDLPLKQWLYEKIFPAEAKFLNPESVYWGALLGCLELIACGTTCMADGYFFQDETVRAVHQSGLRGLIAQGIVDFPAPGVEDPKENIKNAEKYIERWHAYSDLITAGMFCHSPLTCSENTLVRAHEISRSFGAPLQIHLSETLEEVNDIKKITGERPVHYLDRMGLICEGLIAAHAVHLHDSEIDCIKANGAKLVHVPECNMKLSSGVSRVAEMSQLGVVIGLGTDGCASNNNMDLFCEMDSASKLSKVMTGDPTSLDAKTVLKMATSKGAAVLGLEKEIGTIERGKKADIIVLDTNRPHLCPIYDPISTVVYAAEGADVRDVIVNGRPLMRNRKFLTLDPVQIMEKVKKMAKEIGNK